MPRKNTKIFKAKWEQFLTPKRFGAENPDINTIDPARSPFIQDYDRLVFSDSFRRLAGKTQVHPLNSNDHIHTRLSHSIEVSSVGRGLGTKLGYFLQSRGELPDFIQPQHLGEIVTCACMAHDIGNPPFGHAGEKAIQDWFKAPENAKYREELTAEEWADFCNFDGNAQGFRVVNVLENDRQKGGFRLTYPAIASLVKYPNNSLMAEANKTSKFNFYTSEKDFFCHVFKSLGLSKNIVKKAKPTQVANTQESQFIRHPLSYLMEAADDICYRIIDMEDARELGILSYEKILESIEPVREKMKLDETRMQAMHSDRSRMSYLRSKLIGVLTQGIFEAYVEHYDAMMYGETINAHIKLTSYDIQAYMKNAKDVFNTIIMQNKQKTALEIGSYSVYKRLLDAFIPAVYRNVLKERHEKQSLKSPLKKKKDSKKNKKNTITLPLTQSCVDFSYKDERALAILAPYSTKNDNFYMSYLCVIDFIAGMTDKYATFLSSQFAGHNHL